MKIIPAINTQSFEEIVSKINLLKDLTKEFHLDVASVSFTGYQTWSSPADLDRLDESLHLNLHLMVELAPQEILKWANKRVNRFIVHLEASPNPDGLIKVAKKTKKEIYVTWSPNMNIDLIEPYLKFVDGVLILGVHPGPSGQKFLDETYKRIDRLKLLQKKLTSLISSFQFKPKQKIMIDGGVNQENIQKIISCCAPDYVVLSSAIYNAPDPKEAYKAFSLLK